MEFYTIPVEDKVILYRPLLKKAFVGNQALADLVGRMIDDPCGCQVKAPDNIQAFLDDIGFLLPDPPEPPAPDRTFKPTTAVLLLTNRCNLRCVYCYADAGVQPAEDLTLDLAKRVIDRVYENALELGKPQFELSFHGGGEPMQAWTVIKGATEYARSKDLRAHVSMVSNGIWSPSQRDWILENLNGLTISIDGGPDTQNHQRPLASGKESFQYVLETIRALDEAKFTYGIRMTATSPWRGRFPEDVRYLCEHTECGVLQVEPAFNINRGEHQQALQEQAEAFVEAFIDAYDITQQHGRRLVYAGARLGLLTKMFCSAPYNALIVNAGGQLVTCYEIASDSHAMSKISTIGHVTEDAVVLEHGARDYLLNFLETKQQNGCSTCFARWHCAGDCYTRSSVAEGDELRVSTARCTMNRAITAQLLLWHIMNGAGVWNGQPDMVIQQPLPTAALG